MSILQPEAGIWYVICWIVVGIRFWSKRLRLGSWRNLQIDDYLVMLAMVCTKYPVVHAALMLICQATLTVLFGLMNIILVTNSNLIAPGDDISTWLPEEFKERIYGSKLTIVVEQMQILTIWTLKACILIMYSRVT
jgi:hypothetical protein